jgi:glycosyltransferase involved in cell wall biosynthesis
VNSHPAAAAFLRRHCTFLVAGDLNTLTGGYVYDRRIIEGLRANGWQVDVLALDAGFPFPTRSALAAAADGVAALPDSALVVCDGLAFGAMPAIAEHHAGRLTWLPLVHHPLAMETGLSPAQQQTLFDSERRALATARHIVATSMNTARTLSAFNVPLSRIAVVEPGTDPAPLAQGSDSATGLSLLCVATVTPRKGHTLLIEALAGLKQHTWTLHCAGSLTRDPSAALALRRAIAAHGLDERVVLHGEVEPARLQALYAHADVFVLPSFHEGYGMALAEALARGLPVISTTAGAIPDTVPAEAGMLLPPGNLPALRAALARLMSEPAWCATLATGARAAREKLPTWPVTCQCFASVLDDLLSTPRAGLRPTRPPWGSRKLGAARRFLEKDTG